MTGHKISVPFCLRQRKERISHRLYPNTMSALLSKEWTIEQVLESYPQAADIFIRLKADCVGCRLDRFCTLEEVARDYDLVLDDFLASLQEAISVVCPNEK